MADDAPRPAWSRPPFEPGNVAAVAHGAHSAAIVSARTAAVREEFLRDYPWLGEADQIKLDVFFTEKAAYDLLTAWIFGVCAGSIEAHARKGAPRTGLQAVPAYLWGEHRRAAANVIKAANDLGLDATSRARITRDLHDVRSQIRDANVAALTSRGAALRELRKGAPG